jgi:hypothetical protein
MPISLHGWVLGYGSFLGFAAAVQPARLPFQNKCTGAIANKDESFLIS